MDDGLLIDLDDDVFDLLRQRAEAHGISMEEEARIILTAALFRDDVEPSRDVVGVSCDN